MIGFTGASLQLQSIITAHTQSWTAEASLRSISRSMTGSYESESESEPYVTTDGHSASLSWNKAPIWGLRPDFYYC
jgi:hypothetical protein